MEDNEVRGGEDGTSEQASLRASSLVHERACSQAKNKLTLTW